MSDDNSFTQPVREITGPLRTHPWQDGPAELIVHGLQHMLQNREDFDRRMAFLLFDLGVETLFKTFLLLDKSASGADGSFTTRSKAAMSESFHEIVEGTRMAAPDRLSADDAKHVLHYHDIRNRLYHRGNGITVPEHHVREYADLAVRLLRVLLDIDLNGFLQEPYQRRQEKEAIDEKNRLVHAKIEEIHQVWTDIIDLLAPRLLRQHTWELFDKKFRQHLESPLWDGDGYELETVLISGRGLQVPRGLDLSILPLSDIDQFFTHAIEDTEVRNYFLALSKQDRRLIISSLFESLDVMTILINNGANYVDPYGGLASSLLSLWPDWPHPNDDGHIERARTNLPNLEFEYPFRDEQGHVIEYRRLTLAEALSRTDILLQGVQLVYDELKAWLDERTAQKWDELHP